MGFHKGDMFEEWIKMSCRQYYTQNLAVINKIPTPTQVIRRNGKIQGAFYEEKSTVDFIGIAKLDKGSAGIAFDAKQTEEVDKFPLGDIRPHQVEYLEKWQQQGGEAFLLIYFTKLNIVYRISITYISWYWKEHIKPENKGKRGFHSIPIQEFQENGTVITPSRRAALDFMKGYF